MNDAKQFNKEVIGSSKDVRYIVKGALTERVISRSFVMLQTRVPYLFRAKPVLTQQHSRTLYS